MNKLQLYITKSFNGYKVLFNINPSEEITRHVHELREVVEKVNYDPLEKNIFYLVTNVSSGTFITVVRTIPTAPVDHLAAWIYIPNELVIDGEQLQHVVDITTRKVSGDRVTTDDVTTLREIYGTEYAVDSDAPAMTASATNGQIAWRSYNGDSGVTLTDLFGAGLFQIPYLDYAGVIFVDGDLGLSVDGADLTSLPISGPAVISPVEKTPEHFVVHVFGRAIDRPVRATLDANVAFVWKHPGFEDVVKEEVITEADFTPTPPDTSASRKAVSASSFQIAAQTGSVPLDDCHIVVNGIDVTNEPHLFTPTELASATVVINCDGYAPYSARMDLASSTRALIRLQERTKVYCFEMPVKSADLGAPVRFKIFTKRTIDESPLEGYVALDDNIQEGESRTNHLAFSRSSAATMLQKGIYLGAGLIVGLLIGWLTNCRGGSIAPTDIESSRAVDSVKEAIMMEQIDINSEVVPKQTPPTPAKEEPKEEVKPVAANAPVNTSAVTADALAYLDNNKEWTREGLEKFPSLKGLFDDMNNFRLEKLYGDWATKLSGSKSFTKLATHAKYGSNPKKMAKSKIEGDTFLKGNDSKITVQSYLNRIDP